MTSVTSPPAGIKTEETAETAGKMSHREVIQALAGLMLGGVLVDTSWLGWRWCFLIGVPSR